jgi:hypothetical protein
MPRKNTIPTTYPEMTRHDRIAALALLIAKAAVRFAQNAETDAYFESDINSKYVHNDTSVKQNKNEIQLKSSKMQSMLFGEDK